MILKEFQHYYDNICYNRSRSEVFTDFIDYCLYILSVGMLREEYTKIEKKYSDEELAAFREMLDIVSIKSEGCKDALGDLFMEFVSHGHNGQFFTPMIVGDFMALSVGADEIQPGQSVYDPSCGSGQLLLSAAKKNVEKEIERPYCYGSDIDLNCVKMCVINMIINSIPGEIAWMNTLTLEHWRSYHIKLIWIDGIWFPLLSVTGAGETNFIQRIEKTLEEKPELIKQINEKVEPRQLSLDFFS